MIEDPTIFTDVADMLNISDPAFIEKDYYAIQLLKLLTELKTVNFRIIFSGGTCLSKAYQNTYRMSEDIDVKFVRTKSNLKRSHYKDLYHSINHAIERSNIFHLTKSPKILDAYRTQVYEIEYPKNFEHSALKPYLKLELVESIIYDPIGSSAIESMYCIAMNKPSEINKIECVNKESIIIEKMIALLWRASALATGSNIKEDQTLIRHVYDVHLLYSTKNINIDNNLLKKISYLSLKDHAKRYKNKHIWFPNNPEKVLSHGLSELKHNRLYEKRYESFLSPLVYAEHIPHWNDALSTVERIHKTLYCD